MRKIVFLLFIIISIVCIANNKKELLIPKEAIRIRVIANSNSIEDQKIKSDIKSDVSNFLAMKIFNVNNYQDANNIIQNNINKQNQNNIQITNSAFQQITQKDTTILSALHKKGYITFPKI